MDNTTDQSSVWSGGLIAIGVVILQVFLSSNKLDSAAYISIYAFALAIPILACNILVNFARRRNTKDDRKGKATFREILFYVVGILASLIGIATAFLHISLTAATLFSLSTLIALAAYFRLAPHRRMKHS
jgi:1,4-dihydroxy-2-naphthoate octaprenyltransferase